MRIGQIPYRKEGVVSKWRKLRDFWSRGAGPGMIPCTAQYTALTPLGKRQLTCMLRRRPATPHTGQHMAYSGGIPVWWG